MRHGFTTRLGIALAILVAAIVSAGAPAQSVRIEAASDQAYVDEPLRLSVVVRHGGAFDGPAIPTVDGLEIRRLPGEQKSSMVRIVNGRRSEETTVGISFEAIPKRTGVFTVPPFVVTIDGIEHRTAPVTFTASVSETGDLLLVRVTGDPESIYVGQRGSMELEIAIRSYRDERLGVVLDEAALWSLVDARNSEWGAWLPALQQLEAERKRPRGIDRTIDGAQYLVYTVSKAFDPIAAGTPDVGDVRIRMNYPTALRRGNDFLFESRLTLAGSRPIGASPSSIDLTVLSPPEGGRPAAWNGAVGDFELVAVARPTEVAVGDPITLSMRIVDRSGRAGLEGVLPPPFGEQPDFETAFRVPRDTPSGTVDGDAKVFTQTIRALVDDVREIPPIEFAYFNPATGTYEVARSEPIAISVKPSAIARLEVETPGPVTTTDQTTERATNGPRPTVPFEGRSTPGTGVLATSGPLALGLVTLPPVAVAGIVLLHRRRVADARDPAARRARLARRTCEARLASARDASTLGDALLGFIADRTGMAAGAATRGDAVRLLQRQGLDGSVVAELDDFLRSCERARFTPGAAPASEAGVGEARSAARALLARIDPRRPARPMPGGER